MVRGPTFDLRTIFRVWIARVCHFFLCFALVYWFLVFNAHLLSSWALYFLTLLLSCITHSFSMFCNALVIYRLARGSGTTALPPYSFLFQMISMDYPLLLLCSNILCWWSTRKIGYLEGFLGYWCIIPHRNFISTLLSLCLFFIRCPNRFLHASSMRFLWA